MNHTVTKQGNKKAFLLAVFVMLLWGMLFPLIKIAYRELELDTSNFGSLLLFAGIRFSLCGAIVLGISKTNGTKLLQVNRTERWGIVWVSLFAVVLHYSFTYIGLSMTDSSKTALLKQAGALLFICFSFLFFKTEPFSLFKIASAFFGLLGILSLNLDFSSLGQGNTGGLAFGFGIGEVLILLASFCSVINNIFAKKMTPKVPSLVLTGYTQLFGGFVLLVLGFITGGVVGTINIRSILVFSLICLANIFSYCIWFSVLKSTSLSSLLIIKFLEPLFSAVLGGLLLNENIFNLSFMLAGLFVFMAILFNYLESKNRKDKVAKKVKNEKEQES